MGGFSLNFSFKCRGFIGLINDSFAKDSSWSIGVSFGSFFGTYRNVWSVKDCYIWDYWLFLESTRESTEGPPASSRIVTADPIL